jgi:hypothetical protein
VAVNIERRDNGWIVEGRDLEVRQGGVIDRSVPVRGPRDLNWEQRVGNSQTVGELLREEWPVFWVLGLADTVRHVMIVGWPFRSTRADPKARVRLIVRGRQYDLLGVRELPFVITCGALETLPSRIVAEGTRRMERTYGGEDL